MDVFLFGGGWRPEAGPLTYRPFIRAASLQGPALIALVIAAAPDQDPQATFGRYAEVFTRLGLTLGQLVPVYVSPAQPLTRAALAALGPTAVFVCGGLTPLYHAALCADPAWLGELRQAQLPFGGFSAGAAIAADRALLGGWQIETAGGRIAVTNDGAAEDLELLAVRPGLGLVPFTVEVHASAWGTLSRLIHAVNAGRTSAGWAVDEDTALYVQGGNVTVLGLGSAYRVEQGAGGLCVSVHLAQPSL